MTDGGQAPYFADAIALPDEECPILDRARASIPILAERAPAASSRARLRRSLPKSHPPLQSKDQFGSDSIPQGWQFPGPIEDFGSGRGVAATIAGSTTCVALRSVKTRAVEYLRPDRLPLSSSTNPVARRKYSRGRPTLIFNFSRVPIMHTMDFESDLAAARTNNV